MLIAIVASVVIQRKSEQKTLSANLADEIKLNEKENKKGHSHEPTKNYSQNQVGTQEDCQHQSIQTDAGSTVSTGVVENKSIQSIEAIKRNKNVLLRKYEKESTVGLSTR